MPNGKKKRDAWNFKDAPTLVGNIFSMSDPTTAHAFFNQVLGQNYMFTKVHV
jgi:hypothetical protein